MLTKSTYSLSASAIASCVKCFSDPATLSATVLSATVLSATVISATVISATVISATVSSATSI